MDYWTYLTDLRVSEIDALKTEVAAGTTHPMDLKKRLARTIVAGFHSEETALRADENWALMFQKKTTAEDLEEVSISAADAGWNEESRSVRLDKVLVAAGLAASGSEATRKLERKRRTCERRHSVRAQAERRINTGTPHTARRQARQDRDHQLVKQLCRSPV